jgi:hypothetical protein
MVVAGWLGGYGHSGDGGHDIGHTDFDTSGGTASHGNSVAVDAHRGTPSIRQLLATALRLTLKAARAIWAVMVDPEFNIADYLSSEAPNSGLLVSSNHEMNTTKVDYRPLPGVLLGTNLDSDDKDPKIQGMPPLSADFTGAKGDTETWVFTLLLGDVDDKGVTRKVWQGHNGIGQMVCVPRSRNTKIKLILYVRRFTIMVRGHKDCEFLVWAEMQELASCTTLEVELMCERANILLDRLQKKLANTPADFATREVRETLPHMGIRSLTASTQEPVAVANTAPAGQTAVASAPGTGGRGMYKEGALPPRRGTLPC